jgi:hypothetical protein
VRVDLVHPAAEKMTLGLEGIGDDKVRVNAVSLDTPGEPARRPSKSWGLRSRSSSGGWRGLNHDPASMVDGG